MDEKQFYIPIVNRDNLCCIICNVDPNEVENSIAKSFFHWQTLKCRFLINLMQDCVIGSPISGDECSFYVITTKNFYQDGALTAMFKRLNLKTSSPLEVTSRIYISCIKYTFEFILAPKWNRVMTQLYIMHREFLTNEDTSPAIKMNLNLVTNSPNDEIFIKLLPFTVKLFPLKLRDLGLPQSVIVDFENDPDGAIHISQFKTLRVSVLPSMRKGRLISVYKKIPDICPFENWVELRRHWKNMYGYRLPESDNGVVYYDIYFPMAGSRSGSHFIYPDICVKEDLIQVPYKNDPAIINHKFIKDLIDIMPKMCSYELKVNEKSLKNLEVMAPMKNVQIAPIIQPRTTDNSEKTDKVPPPTDENLCQLDEFNRKLTTSMSPTPSLMGKRTNTTKQSFQFENLKKIKKIHELKPSTTYHLSLSGESHQHQPIKPCGILFGKSIKSPAFNESTNHTSTNIFMASASSIKNSNGQYKKPLTLPLRYNKPFVVGQENISRISLIKK